MRGRRDEGDGRACVAASEAGLKKVTTCGGKARGGGKVRGGCYAAWRGPWSTLVGAMTREPSAAGPAIASASCTHFGAADTSFAKSNGL